MKSRDLIIVLVVFALVVGGGVVYRNRQEEIDAIRKAFREAGVKQNVDPDIMDAITVVETGRKMKSVNLSGPDASRGGSYGPSQISAKTARAYGFKGDMLDLTKDPDLAAYWTAFILRARPGGPPDNVWDAAAWWNGGRVTFDRLPMDNTARTDYAPKLAAAYTEITEGATS